MPLKEPDVLLRGEHVAEGFLGNVRLKHIATFAHLHLLRVRAVSRRVMLNDAALEFVVEPAYCAVLADVGIRQAARNDAADMRRFFEHDDLRAALRRRHRRRDSRGISRDNNDIRLLGHKRCGESEKESE